MDVDTFLSNTYILKPSPDRTGDPSYNEIFVPPSIPRIEYFFQYCFPGIIEFFLHVLMFLSGNLKFNSHINARYDLNLIPYCLIPYHPKLK